MLTKPPLTTTVTLTNGEKMQKLLDMYSMSWPKRSRVTASCCIHSAYRKPSLRCKSNGERWLLSADILCVVRTHFETFDSAKRLLTTCRQGQVLPRLSITWPWELAVS